MRSSSRDVEMDGTDGLGWLKPRSARYVLAAVLALEAVVIGLVIAYASAPSRENPVLAYASAPSREGPWREKGEVGREVGRELFFPQSGGGGRPRKNPPPSPLPPPTPTPDDGEERDPPASCDRRLRGRTLTTSRYSSGPEPPW